MRIPSVICLFLVACQFPACNPKPTRPTPAAPIKYIKYEAYPWVGRETNLWQLTEVLEQSEFAAFGGIGIEGRENLPYDCYDRLLEIAPDSTWVRLSHSDKPVARLYAFEALYSRKSPELATVAARLKKDLAAVECIRGCVSDSVSICVTVRFRMTGKL